MDLKKKKLRGICFICHTWLSPLGYFTVRMHVISWHLRWGQALSEGVCVPVLLFQSGETHLLLMLLLLLNVGIRGAQTLHLRGQTATGGRCGAQETHRGSDLKLPLS